MFVQLIDKAQVAERLEFYAKNHISFVARPPGNRKGLFKKASNMNYSLHLSQEISKMMEENSGMGHSEAMHKVGNS
jgi:hypothetical protein